MDFKKQKPIYLQIADRLMEQILAGATVAGGRMASVRDVAAQMGVNPNTVMRSFEHLAQNGIISQQRGVGYFVNTDACNRIIALQRREFIDEELPYIRQKMKLLGITPDELM